jgi:phosphohistidine phosphatase SixA
MRELILLRHAHAEPATPGQADLDRPLSPVGLAEAEAAGKWLKENNLLPDCVLCSPARRTETLEAVLAPSATSKSAWKTASTRPPGTGGAGGRPP